MRIHINKKITNNLSTALYQVLKKCALNNFIRQAL